MKAYARPRVSWCKYKRPVVQVIPSIHINKTARRIWDLQERNLKLHLTVKSPLLNQAVFKHFHKDLYHNLKGYTNYFKNFRYAVHGKTQTTKNLCQCHPYKLNIDNYFFIQCDKDISIYNKSFRTLKNKPLKM